MRMWLFAVLLLTSGGVNLAKAQSPVATVRLADGQAWVRKEKDAKPSLLRNGEGLYAGQWVSCAKGCRGLIISQCRLNVPVTSVPTWRRIIAINCFPTSGTRGGREKGEGVSIISPKDSERLRPNAFSLRWKPFPAATKLELSLRIYLGEKIWSQKAIDGSKGSYESPSLKTALRKAQETNHLVLLLTLDDGKTQMQSVKFYLVSIEDQSKLESQLGGLKNETSGILRAAGRGAVFGDYQLYAEANKEFEKALAIAEKQKVETGTLAELTALTIQASYMAYNDDRVKELCKSPRLPVSTLPEACSIHQ